MISLTHFSARLRNHFLRIRERFSLALRLCGKASRDLWMDGGLTQAAAISYYLVVSIFPMLLLLIGVAGFFLKPQDIQNEVMGWLSQYFPTGTRMVFRDNIQAIINTRSSITTLGFAALIWSCTLMFDAINQAINAAWGMRGNASFFKDKLKSLLLICVVAAAALLSAFLTTRMALITRFENFLEAFPFLEWPLDLGKEIAGMLIPFFLSAVAFGLAYRLLPRLPISIRDVWPAAVCAAILWEASKWGFVWYLTEHTEYRQIYGSISAVLVLMIWAYVSSLILAWGAELTSEIWKERRKIEKGNKDDYPFMGAV